jgi:hypothetical protein
VFGPNDGRLGEASHGFPLIILDLSVDRLWSQDRIGSALAGVEDAV